VKREGWGETEKGTDDGKKRKKWREKTRNGIDSEKKTGKSGYKRKENSWSHSPRLAAPSCWLAGCFSVTSAPCIWPAIVASSVKPEVYNVSQRR